MEKLGRQNLAMFQRAMSLFSPFAQGGAGNGAAQNGAGRPAEPASADEIALLKERLNAMQADLERLSRAKRGEES
jgi:polyhydroxyalkanoate synthesis regulator protein